MGIRRLIRNLFSFKENSIERIVLLLMAVTSPLLLLIESGIRYYEHIHQYILFRLVLSATALVLYFLSFRVSYISRHLRVIIYGLLYILESNFIFLAYVNNFSFYFSSLLVSSIIITCLFFNAWRHLLIYQSVMLLLVFQASLLSINSELDVWITMMFYTIINVIVFFIQLYIYKKNFELTRAARDLDIAHARLERSNKSLEQFAYIASHDLQEPLRTVNSYMQLFERRYKDKVQQDGKEFIQIAVDAVKRMQTLIQGLLKYSRASSERMELRTVDLNEVLGDALNNLQTSLEENHAQIQSSTLPVLQGDKLQLLMLFQNLISNSLKYRSSVDPVIAIHNEISDRRCIISIEDNGIGIPEQYRESIFRIFSRVHNGEGNGTGIGLAVCKKIVSNHNGEIWVQSEEGKGSRFCFSLLLN